MNETLQKITSLWRHIEEVQKNCFIIAEKLIADGHEDLARQLLTNSLVHDQSKFLGMEWEYLLVEAEEGEMYEKKRLAISHHRSVNAHHPEFWRGIKNMPEVYLAEMAADIKARSTEFGTDLRSWIDRSACPKYGFTKRDKVYRTLKKYVDILCPKPFA